MLPRPHRLAKDEDLKRLFKVGRLVSNGWGTLKIARNRKKVSRFAVIVGTKVSKNATVRNRLKRQVREAIRNVLPKVQKGFDISVLPRATSVGFSLETHERWLNELLKRSRLL